MTLRKSPLSPKLADSLSVGKDQRLVRLLLILVKVAFSAAILAYLGWQARDHLGQLSKQVSAEEKVEDAVADAPPHADQTAPDSREKSVDWLLLSLSALVCLAMVMVTFVRWYLLVRALELPFRLRDAFRLGFLGYMFNFVSLGSVGGDLFRAIFIAREQHGRRAEAVATVVIDRVIGLYALFIVASVAVLATGLLHHPHEVVRILCHLTLLGTAVSTLLTFVVLTPGFTNGRLSRWMGELPRVGRLIRRLLGAVRMYRQKPSVLIVTGLMSLLVHSLSTAGIYLAALGLPGAAPDLSSHFLIVPLAMLVAAVPIFPAGLGGFELVLDKLYVEIPLALQVTAGTGLMVALVYRVTTIGIAIIGFCYYLANRAIVRQVMKQVSVEEQMEEELSHDPGSVSKLGVDSSRSPRSPRSLAPLGNARAQNSASGAPELR
jgi:uncharacterized protein (TIRG00374 family)